jgi:hypothetical protein
MEVEILGHYYHITAWTSYGSGMWYVYINIYMNNGALRAVKKLYICLCIARDSNSGYCIPLKVGCLTSPAWTAPLPEPIYKKIKARSIAVLDGDRGGIGIDRLRY